MADKIAIFFFVKFYIEFYVAFYLREDYLKIFFFMLKWSLVISSPSKEGH